MIGTVDVVMNEMIGIGAEKSARSGTKIQDGRYERGRFALYA